ncbi:MAG: hypothetical protein ACREIK_00390 [Nitrospiraceae bacterium]
MTRKPFDRGLGRPALAGLLLFGSLTGCLSPIAMHRAVVEYDRTGSQIDAELLLLNIARARHYRPVHFTTVSSVAATFDFRVNSGIIGRIGSTPLNADARPVDLEFSSSVAEQPTITIVPITGEEFTKRILRPLEESQFYFLVHQEFDINMILRLMARGMEIAGEGEPTLLFNAPSRRADYEEFRKRLLHLSSLQLTRKLYVGPITYDESFTVPVGRAPTPEEAVAGLEKGYRWTVSQKDQQYTLSRRVVGRIAITNYDTDRLSNEERRRMNEEAEQSPRDSILADIRPGNPGGDYPLHGSILLRSLNAIIIFLAKGIAEEPEFHVDKNPKTGPVMRNPSRTLEIEESSNRPTEAEFSVELEGHYYSIRKFPISEGMVPSWNQEAFAVLSNLFQMTVTEVSVQKMPIISIPKG